MSYVISLCELRELCGEENLSTDKIASRMIDCVKKNKEIMKRYYEFNYFLENDYGVSSVEEVELPFTSLVKEFDNSESYYDFIENFKPMICYIHITQYIPSSKELELLVEHCPSTVWIELEGVFQGIGLTGAGMDFSDSLELAYYIIDRESPIRATQRLSLSERNWDILLKMREAVDNREYLNLEKLLKGEE